MITLHQPGLVERTQAPASALPDPVAAAEAVLRMLAPRAISLLTSAPTDRDLHILGGRLSANDCYAALDEACRKVARVAVRRYAQARIADRSFADALPALFPDPVAYMARAIRSVTADAGRRDRREIPTVSLDQPVTAGRDGGQISLIDTIADVRPESTPSAHVEARFERDEFRSALKQAFRAIPSNYVEALARDLDRERRRMAGDQVPPESDRDRQTVCRARSALAKMLRSECSEDNPYIQTLMRQRTSRVRPKTQPSQKWTGERQTALFQRILDAGWSARAASSSEETVGEAIVNDVTRTGSAAPPSPELRQSMRVLDLYTVDRPTPRSSEAAAHYEKARSFRSAGDLERAVAAYRACYEEEPQFIEALNEVGVLYSQMGRLRDAMRIYQRIIDLDVPGDHKYIAATNAADIYLTWYDAGRSRERNIQLALEHAKTAMARPTPMRACNLLLALVKDRYYFEARDLMRQVVSADEPRCRAERFLQTLFQIRDADLVAWWSWLDDEMQKEQ